MKVKIEKMIKTGLKSLRDPFVLVTEEAYYLYGTDVGDGGWNNSVLACYKSTEGLSSGWHKTDELVYERPKFAEKQLWAPEVHKYKDSYYMITSYFSSDTEHRGCSILKAPTPEGKFVEITNGQITPKDWDAIDGTLYVDEDGAPWLIFVHEWTSTEDKIGRMAAARLGEDLTHLITEPKELFRADDPSWTENGTTDGPFMYKTKDGELLMLWSNFVERDYCVGIARSKSARPDGEWTQDERLLFSKEITGNYDGGHGMIFTDRDGKMYLSVHSPNLPTDTVKEEVVFIPVSEENGRLICNITI